MNQLILGGARSGKSRYAEKLAIESGKPLVLLATGQAADEEMAARITLHQSQRSDQWRVIEEPINLGRALNEVDDGDSAVVIDCLTLWLSNCLHEDVFDLEKRALLEVLPQLRNDIYIVSNEVGSGIVPLGPLSREFVDQSGWLHQSLAEICEKVTVIIAGLPLPLKGQL